MPGSKLDQLKTMTTVVADTGDINAIEANKPEDATTNPTLVLKAIQSGKYPELPAQAKKLAQDALNSSDIEDLSDSLAVIVGNEILKTVPGLVSTEVDARLSFDTQATVAKAEKLIGLYEHIGISKDRILIKIASTWEGIQAAKVLEQKGIRCNLTLLFAMAQAKACADAGATLISPFVGRILDWYKNANPETDYSGDKDPGVQSVKAIYQHYKEHGINTVVMGASFRSQEEIECLAGCDKLTISPALLDSLAADQGELARRLNAFDGEVKTAEPITEQQFRLDLNNDAMATEKLAEGIRNFIKDQEALEKLLLSL